MAFTVQLNIYISPAVSSREIYRHDDVTSSPISAIADAYVAGEDRGRGQEEEGRKKENGKKEETGSRAVHDILPVPMCKGNISYTAQYQYKSIHQQKPMIQLTCIIVILIDHNDVKCTN